MKEAVKHFETNANQYKGPVYDKVIKEVLEQIFSQMFMCFNAQLKMIGHKIFDEFDVKIRKMSKRDSINDTFTEQTSKLMDSCMKKFKVMSAELIIENSGWGNQVHQNNTDLEG